MQAEIFAPPGMEELTQQIQGMFQNIGGGKKSRKLKIKEALKLLTDEEAAKLVNDEDVKLEAVKAVEQNGIVFLDEIDKIASRSEAQGADVSRQGVQRDLLPLVEGTTVSTKYGMIKTDHILFIASGAFHLSKPSDLIPELQGRFPIRVELDSLSVADFECILTQTDACLTRQYQALLATEGVAVEFADDGIRRMAEIAYQVNEKTENIGARRLHTVMEKLLEEVSFEAGKVGWIKWRSTQPTSMKSWRSGRRRGLVPLRAVVMRAGWGSPYSPSAAARPQSGALNPQKVSVGRAKPELPPAGDPVPHFRHRCCRLFLWPQAQAGNGGRQSAEHGCLRAGPGLCRDGRQVLRPGGLRAAGAGWFLVLATCGLLAWPIARLVGIQPKTLVPPMLFNNSGNIGLPLAVLAWGEDAAGGGHPVHGREYAAFLLRCPPARSDDASADALAHPVVFAAIAGLAVALLKIPIWQPLVIAIKMLGDVSVPLLLFSLGVRMTDVNFSEWKVAVGSALLRPLAGMAIAYGVMPARAARARCSHAAGVRRLAAGRAQLSVCRALQAGAKRRFHCADRQSGGADLPAAGPGARSLTAERSICRRSRLVGRPWMSADGSTSNLRAASARLRGRRCCPAFLRRAGELRWPGRVFRKAPGRSLPSAFRR
jgi:hypothetical protein